MTKEESSSPTVSTESVLLTSIIDAQEGREVAVIDIPNAFESKMPRTVSSSALQE